MTDKQSRTRKLGELTIHSHFDAPEIGCGGHMTSGTWRANVMRPSGDNTYGMGDTRQQAEDAAMANFTTQYVAAPGQPADWALRRANAILATWDGDTVDLAHELEAAHALGGKEALEAAAADAKAAGMGGVEAWIRDFAYAKKYGATGG